MTVIAGAKLGRYTVVAPIGSGGMGEVYRARDDILERDVAIKIMPEPRWVDPKRRARFEREARVLARISHPNIVAIHDFGTDGGVSFAVTELLEGENLRDRVRTGALDWQEAAHVLGCVAEGLACAHSQGIVHRDLKPENIFLTTDGGVKILDFGIARLTTDDPWMTTTTLTRPGTVMGTVGYMSPEQLSGRPVDGRSDLFSLGTVLYESVAGIQPFTRENDAETMYAILHQAPADLATTDARAPVGFHRVVARCLEKDPTERYGTAEELAAELRLLLAERQRPPRGLARRWRDRIPRWRSWKLVSAVAMASVVLTLGAFQVARWLGDGGSPLVDPRSVRIDGFENRTGDRSLDGWSEVAAGGVSAALLASGMVGVADAEEPGPSVSRAGFDGLPLLGVVREGTEAAAAAVVVEGDYYLRDGTIEFHGRVRDRIRGELVHVIEPVRGPTDEMDALSEELGNRFRDAVLWHLDPRTRFGTSVDPPVFEAYREFVLGMEEFENLWEHERPVSHLERAARLDREFLEPRVWLLPLYWELCVGQSDSPRCSDFESLMNELGASPESLSPVGRIVVRGHEARLRGHSVLALRVLRDLLDLAPDDPGLRWLVADAALRARRYEEAVEILEPFDENGPEAAWFRKPRAKVLEDAYHMTGNYLAEEDLARRTADAYPDDGFVRRRLARSLAAQGRIEEVSALVDQTFAEDNVFNLVDFLLVAGTELRVHGWREPSIRAGERWLEWLEAQEAEGPVKEEEPRVLLRTCRARALELADRQEEAREEWTSLAAESWEPNAFTRLFRLTPSFFLSRTALAAARDGDGEEAREAAALLAGKGGTYSYGSRSLFHAELASLLGDRDAAIAALRQALREGYPYPLSLHRDAAFDPIRGDEEFEELVYPED